jgi:acetyltransferase-like isoleucine patch superfamily enzyme
MKQITAQDGAVFGPFTTITKLEDRYDCDGQVHLPFTVVGDNCVIGEYVEPTPTEENPPA